ncbi:hypothetical protein ES706_03510 [subsurface metagenome]
MKSKNNHLFGMLKKKSQKRVEEEIESELRGKIERIFEEKKKKLRIDATLDLRFIDDIPIIGENVYGEAFPFERPPRIWLEVFAPDARTAEIIEHICHELIHIQHPEPGEEEKEFKRRIRECIKN